MVGIDSTILSLILYPKARAPEDPTTGKPIERLEDRIEQLLEDLDNDGERIIIPTPVLAEFLVLAGKDGPKYLDDISARKTFFVRPFDEMAAIELAAQESEARRSGDKRGGSIAPWQKVKIDRQIVVTAKVNGAKRIYADDRDIRILAPKLGIEVISSWELPLPAAKQLKMYDEESSETNREGIEQNQNPAEFRADNSGGTGNPAGGQEAPSKEVPKAPARIIRGRSIMSDGEV
jgi:predicted nucleic acid-binding protein